MKFHQGRPLNPLGLFPDRAQADNPARVSYFVVAVRAFATGLDEHIGTYAPGRAILAPNLTGRVAPCGRRADA